MRNIFFAASVILIFLVINACKKSASPNNTNTRTVQSFSGSYSFTAITANALGQTIDLYDSLPACERDNTIQLDVNGLASFIDAGIACVPKSDSSGTWSLSQNTDTIYLAGSASNTAFYIKSWDGSTLVLTNLETVQPIPVPVTVTSTLAKK
jgi:Lipocalin-like domain